MISIFDDDGRADVLRYVTEKYGAEKVAHIITYGTMAAKSAIKDVARVTRVPLAESDRLTKMIPDKLPEVDGKSPKVNLKNCYTYVPELQHELNYGSPMIRETLKYALSLEGNVRNTGVHACGVIIGRDDITDWVPVATATDKDNEKVLVTQYEGSVIESTGLIKMDFLGLKTLSIIKGSCGKYQGMSGRNRRHRQYSNRRSCYLCAFLLRRPNNRHIPIRIVGHAKIFARASALDV